MSPTLLGRVCTIAFLASAPGATFTQAAAPCEEAFARATVCEAANQRALKIMKTGNLEAIVVMQDVHTGSLVAFAASDPAKFDITTALLPLSPVKLLAAATWLEHDGARQADGEKLLADSIASGNDNAGRRIASEVRKAVGTEKVLDNLAHYGFPAGRQDQSKMDTTYWAELAPRWQAKLLPATTYHSLGSETTTKDWEDTLSIGEERFVTTALHVSRFLQAVGNGGVMLPAFARAEERPGSTMPATTAETRVMSESTASKLQTAMRGTVEHGTAKSAKPVLAGTGWTMGGKTGTGPEPGTTRAGPASDGCFVGLIFGPDSKARFTVVTYVRHGGFGGENAARISAELARFVIGAD